MILVESQSHSISGIDDSEVLAFHGFDKIRQADMASIRRFVERHRNYLRGRVLDFGSGLPGTCRKPEPYRDLVAGEYVAYDKGNEMPGGQFDAILSTQVLQYIFDPVAQVRELAQRLRPGGHLLVSYPTNWDEVEREDLWRFTAAGMEAIIVQAGLIPIHHDRRAAVKLNGFQFPLGYGLVARKPMIRAKLSQEESARLLTAKIEHRDPFMFLRYGDGAIECMNGLGKGRTCDGEEYSEVLGRALREAWALAGKTSGLICGDWLTASFDSEDSRNRYPIEWESLCGIAAEWVHFETLIWNALRPSYIEISRFYRAIANDARRKAFMGPEVMADAANRLGCKHIVTPMNGMFERADEFTDALTSDDFEVLLWGCGMAGSIPAVRCRAAFPERTYINIGSSLDPLYRGRTRTQQVKPALIRRMLGWT